MIIGSDIGSISSLDSSITPGKVSRSNNGRESISKTMSPGSVTVNEIHKGKLNIIYYHISNY